MHQNKCWIAIKIDTWNISRHRAGDRGGNRMMMMVVELFVGWISGTIARLKWICNQTDGYYFVYYSLKYNAVTFMHSSSFSFSIFLSLSGTRSLVPFVRSLSCQFTYECCTWWRSEESRLKLTFRISSWMNCVHMERTSINTRQTLLLSMPGEYMQMNSCVYSTSHYCNNWVSRLRVGSAFLSISLSKCFQMEK